MKKIINIDRKPIMVDTETAFVTSIDRSTRGIDDVYVIPEDAHILGHFSKQRRLCQLA